MNDDIEEQWVDKQTIDRNALDDAIKKFLAKGGKITQIPAGITTLGAIADHEARRKLDRIKSFGDKG